MEARDAQEPLLPAPRMLLLLLVPVAVLLLALLARLLMLLVLAERLSPWKLTVAKGFLSRVSCKVGAAVLGSSASRIGKLL
jgi:hypothetical protein